MFRRETRPRRFGRSRSLQGFHRCDSHRRPLEVSQIQLELIQEEDQGRPMARAFASQADMAEKKMTTQSIPESASGRAPSLPSEKRMMEIVVTTNIRSALMA